MQQLTVSIIGVGARGGYTYGSYMNENPDKFRIAALCDLSEEKLQKFGERFGVPERERFTDENAFFERRRSDILIVSVLDKDHVRIAERGLKLGYHLLLEKPVSDSREELEGLLAAAKGSDSVVMVCHVLRYTAAVCKLRALLDEGRIGQLVAIDDLEQVAYWHFAHSYVRGNWHDTRETAPAILTKCCHDLDLMQYFAGSRCTRLTSMGELRYFRPENAPEGCGSRCLTCKAKADCPYDAEKIYLERWEREGCPDAWPYQVLSDRPLTREVLLRSLREGPYGTCVFAGKNNAADHQTVQAEFENGIHVTLRMMAFTAGGGRRIRFFGSEGDLEYIEDQDRIVLSPFGKDPVVWRVSELTDDLSGHGGGDKVMVDSLYEILTGRGERIDTSLENSIESHLMAIAAEQSRLAGGKLIQVHQA